MIAFELLHRLIVQFNVIAIFLLILEQNVTLFTGQWLDVLMRFHMFGQLHFRTKITTTFGAFEYFFTVDHLTHVTFKRRFAGELFLATIALEILLVAAVMFFHMLAIRVPGQQFLFANFTRKFHHSIGIVFDQFVSFQAIALTECVTALIARERLFTAAKTIEVIF